MSIGGTLAAARQAAGMSVAQLSGRTRIRETVIYAIERDDFSLCGGDFYARGHVRNIAKTLGLDPQAVAHQFDEEHGGPARPVRAAAVFQAEHTIKLRDRRSPNWSTAMAIALALVAVFGVTRVMSGSGDPVATGPDPRRVPPKSSPSVGVSTHPKAARPAGDLVTLRVTAKRRTWLDVTDAKGKRIFRGVLPAGGAATWKARKLMKVTFGNAGGVDLEVNGRHIGPPGRSGELVRRSFRPEASGAR
ncbi:membrane protein [Sphaerisporangium rufum]|uniref:Membrane protein n=1 Tax=Sphaerisporangium rufum TaxID=1381558 RepID=A0A919UYP7_9ACTN|nr:helix-turn-helix domain-containing protein [Sphaerisporangium rufum]GII78266.1 membrane protein [Sphaerisporangium rufum]